MSQQTSTVHLCGEGSAVASRQNESTAEGNLARRPAENSKDLAPSACKTNEDSSNDTEGYAGSRSHTSSSRACHDEDGDDIVEEVPPPEGFSKPTAGGSSHAGSATTSARGLRPHPRGTVPAHKKANVGAGPATNGGKRDARRGLNGIRQDKAAQQSRVGQLRHVCHRQRNLPFAGTVRRRSKGEAGRRP